MFIIQAPYPLIQTTSILPDPKFSDAESLQVEVNRKLAVDGTRRTYIKRKDRRKLLWSFKLTRNKALELRAFVYAYFASIIKVTDHNDRVWIINLVGNPFEFDTIERGGPAVSPMPRGEVVSIDLEAEGIEQ